MNFQISNGFSYENSSSGSPDEFSALHLKQCCKSLAHPLQLLYKSSLKKGEIPLNLKRAIITTIYKRCSRDLTENYGPVALSPHLKKILEKIIAKNIHQYLVTHQKVNPACNMTSDRADPAFPRYWSITTRNCRKN